MSTYYLTPNTQSDGIYTGLAYVFDTLGGFSVNQSFPQIDLNVYSPVAQYDVTEALQIRFNVRTFNEKIGIIKQDNNGKSIEVLYFDKIKELLTYYVNGTIRDTVTVNSNDFLSGVKTNNIVSMGKMSSLYSDFNYTVMEYFGAPYGFSSVFSNASDFNINNGIFDASAFINLINGITFHGTTGSVISDLSGYFTINDLNKHLRFICSTNVFGNRPLSDNFGVPDGFVPGDLIYIPNGISVKLSVDIETEPYYPRNNFGPTNLQSVNSIVNYSEPQNNIHKVTTSTLSNITQTYSVPILIILDSEDNFNFNNYGNTWTDVGVILGLNNKNWLSVAISSSGKCQSIVDDNGDIYISSDYGIHWVFAYNMGYSPTISIGMSELGEYQTASNGINIFISDNTGQTWRNVYNLGSSNIYVSVSLSGKYQTILSCGDSLYMSDDHGNNWIRLTENDNIELYNSIETFPTGAVSMSFSGEYQTIASESIYVSKNYGKTWINVFEGQDFFERNWDGISMSSTGEYQSAIDNGGFIYTSNDYGKTWISNNNLNTLNKTWQSISISANGNLQTALDNNGGIFVSNDGGNTWNNTTSGLGLQNNKWQAVAVSANGQYQTAVVYGGSFYTSNLL